MSKIKHVLVIDAYVSFIIRFRREVAANLLHNAAAMTTHWLTLPPSTISTQGVNVKHIATTRGASNTLMLTTDTGTALYYNDIKDSPEDVAYPTAIFNDDGNYNVLASVVAPGNIYLRCTPHFISAERLGMETYRPKPLSGGPGCKASAHYKIPLHVFDPTYPMVATVDGDTVYYAGAAPITFTTKIAEFKLPLLVGHKDTTVLEPSVVHRDVANANVVAIAADAGRIAIGGNSLLSVRNDTGLLWTLAVDTHCIALIEHTVAAAPLAGNIVTYSVETGQPIATLPYQADANSGRWFLSTTGALALVAPTAITTILPAGTYICYETPLLVDEARETVYLSHYSNMHQTIVRYGPPLV